MSFIQKWNYVRSDLGASSEYEAISGGLSATPSRALSRAASQERVGSASPKPRPKALSLKDREPSAESPGKQSPTGQFHQSPSTPAHHSHLNPAMHANATTAAGAVFQTISTTNSFSPVNTTLNASSSLAGSGHNSPITQPPATDKLKALHVHSYIVDAQVLRSISRWSGGVATEASIGAAYTKLIEGVLAEEVSTSWDFVGGGRGVSNRVSFCILIRT